MVSNDFEKVTQYASVTLSKLKRKEYEPFRLSAQPANLQLRKLLSRFFLLCLLGLRRLQMLVVKVAIGGGGFVPGRILREHLRARMLSVVLEHYSDSTGERHAPGAPAKIQWLDQSCEHLVQSRRVLVVDEVDDTRETLAFVVSELTKLEPEAISVFVIHNKMKEKRAEFHADVGYLAAEEVPDSWMVYPWEALDYDQHVVQAKEKKLNPDHLSL